MHPLYTINQFDSASSTTKLECLCKRCAKVFLLDKKQIVRILKLNSRHTGDFCSPACYSEAKSETNRIKTVCKNCNNPITKTKAEWSANGNYCNRSCAATYNNKNKKFGCRTSKFELYCQGKLKTDFPLIEFIFNGKSTIGSEIDIYVPALRLAFELNGIVHYEPIYGVDKFEKIKDNDKQKFITCYEKGIEFVIIDTSRLTYNVEKRFLPYYERIHNIIKANLGRLE